MKISRMVKIVSVTVACLLIIPIMIAESVPYRIGNFMDNFCINDDSCAVSSCGCWSENSKMNGDYCLVPPTTSRVDQTKPNKSCECVDFQCAYVTGEKS